MKIPYGMADFLRLRTEGYLYVDRTDRITTLEELGNALLFLRPRRFGKSLWLSTLDNYYNFSRADDHDALFGELAIGKNPTPLAHRCVILRWDFSLINPSPPPRGVNANVSSKVERIGNEIHGYLNSTLRSLLSDQRDHLPEMEISDDAFRSLDNLLDVVRQTPYRLYLLIDEYDNFANEVLTADQGAYEELVHSDGPFKYLFKWVKAAMAGQGIDRLFITGVSPMVMADVTSGMNIALNIYLYSELHSLCGFTEQEVTQILEELHDEADGEKPSGKTPWAVPDALAMMRDWYNGYRFAIGAEETVYNPTLVLYFLKFLQRTGEAPRQMLDSNLAADEGKLEYLAKQVAGHGKLSPQDEASSARTDTFIDLIRKDQPLQIRQLHDRFTLRELLEHSAQDHSFLGSYLYYFGMLTLKQEAADGLTLELEVPNEVMHGLYVERIRKILMPLGVSRSTADALLFASCATANSSPCSTLSSRTSSRSSPTATPLGPTS